MVLVRPSCHRRVKAIAKRPTKLKGKDKIIKDLRKKVYDSEKMVKMLKRQLAWQEELFTKQVSCNTLILKTVFVQYTM